MRFSVPDRNQSEAELADLQRTQAAYRAAPLRNDFHNVRAVHGTFQLRSLEKR